MGLRGAEMKKFFGSRAFVLLGVVLSLIIAMSVLSVVFEGTASPVTNALGTVASPFRAVVSRIGGFFSGIGSYINDFEELKAENSMLRVKIAEMEEQVRRSQQALEENERLRELLELSERRRDFTFVMAEIVSRDSSNWESSFTIGKGSVHGIDAHDCVVDEEGNLVGIVSEVGTNWAVVTTVIDSSTELGALIYRTREAAVAEGDFTLMGKGKLKVTYLPEDTVLMNGDLILTSGVGGVYPKELVIGSVTEVEIVEGGAGSYAVVQPEAELDRLTQVFVISSFDIEE